MFALIVNTPDYTNMKFINDEEVATKEYLEEVVDLQEDDDSQTSVALIHIKGEGNFQIGYEFDGDKNIEVLRSYPDED